MSRLIQLGWLSVMVSLPLPALASPGAEPAVCATPTWMDERLDYYSPTDQTRIRQIEYNHFDAETEALKRGKTGGSGGHDIDFLVRYVPNHPRGLAALVRLSLRDKAAMPFGVQQPVECYLQRALVFRPDDAEVNRIFGTYLARLGRPRDALQRYQDAERIAGEDPLLAYNMGLVLLDLGEPERALAYARRAYAAGVELTGLRDRLKRAGHWRE